MIGIIFLVVLFSTLWTAVIVLSLPLAIAIVPTLAVAAAAGGVFAYRRLQARKAAQEIERSLKAQGDAYAKQVRPDQQPEIEEMQAEFSKAVGSLKGSKLARGGIDALSVLPWYMIIGPPGVGKSTALRNSGLQFPYLSARGGGVRGVGGTRNCEWWLTNEAVILDTAGRYTTEDDDRDEWFAFLDMLAKNRPKRPINGLLVAVSAAELVELDEEGAAALGQRIRERVDEVMARLKVILPVYVMFNKCDLLAGFVEMFGDLPKGERGQIWGSTEPVATKAGSAAEVFGARFDELAIVIEEKALKRIGQTRRLEDRETVFQFPAQFEGLRANLAEFIRTLFAENVYQDTPVMRGFYFSSATQEGRPIDRMMNAMASAFGVRGALPAPSESAVETKSYFLNDFFARVLFKDQALAVLSTKETKRRGVLQYGYSAAGFAVAALVMLFPTLSFFNNRELLQTTRAMVDSAKGGGAENALLKLEPLRERLEDLLEGGHGLMMGFGMYQGDALLASMSGFYGASVRRALVEPVIDRNLADLQDYVAKQAGTQGELGSREALPYFRKLKLYLLISAPKEKSEPALGEAEQAWAARQLATDWTSRPGISPRLAKAARADATLYLKLLSRNPSLAIARSESAVSSSRRVLQRLPGIAPVLEQMVDELSGESSDLALASLLDRPLASLKGSGQIRGAFTKKVYRERICDTFVARMKNWDGWVVQSERTPSDPEAAAQDLRLRYFNQYVTEWRQFLDLLTMEGPSDDTQALVILDDLTKGDPPPLGRLFQNVAANVRLTEREIVDFKDAKGSIERGIEKIKGAVTGGGASVCHEDGEKLVDAAFEKFVSFGAAPAALGGSAPKKKELPLDSYQEQLQAVRDALRAHQDVAARIQTATTHVQTLIDGQEVTWRQRFKALLLPPLTGTKQLDVKKKSGEVSQKWCSEVYEFFKKNLSNRYPFNPRGQDATLADLTDFFKPNGTVWSFYEKELKTDVVKISDRFQYAKGLGVEAASVYKHDLLNFLSRAQQVRNALFPSNATEAQLTFAAHIRPPSGSVNVASVTLTVDGQPYSYSNGPEDWPKMKWPVVGKTEGASIVVRTSRDSDSIERRGEWGFFHLLEEGTIRNSVSGYFTVSWHFPKLNAEVFIDFKPVRNETLFGVLRDGQPPQLLQAFRTAGITPPVAAGYNAGGCTK